MTVCRTSDMVCVVRCSACRYGDPEVNALGEDMVMCTNTDNPLGYDGRLMPPEWFCADGEAKEDE